MHTSWGTCSTCKSTAWSTLKGTTVTKMTSGTTIPVGKLRRLCSLSDQTVASWRLSGFGFCRMLLCAVALMQFLQSAALSGEETDCKDTIRVELHISARGGGKEAQARAFLWQHWSEK